MLGGRVSRPGNPSKAQPANPPVEGGVRQSSAFLVQSEPGTWATRLKEGTGTLRSWTILQTGTVTVPTSRAPAVRRMQRLVLQRGPHGTFVAPRGGGGTSPHFWLPFLRLREVSDMPEVTVSVETGLRFRSFCL